MGLTREKYKSNILTLGHQFNAALLNVYTIQICTLRNALTRPERRHELTINQHA